MLSSVNNACDIWNRYTSFSNIGRCVEGQRMVYS